MAETQPSKNVRFVSYCCSHAWKQFGNDPIINYFDRWLPMTRLSESGQNVTQINLGQWWYAPDRSKKTLFLNDTAWDEPGSELNSRIFSEAKHLQAKGIKVLAQLTYFWANNGFGQDGGFNEDLYLLLHRMLSQLGLDGVDLDVEDHSTDNSKVIAVVKRLKKDFGTSFLITMAPGGDELLDQNAGRRSLSSIYYKELYQEIGCDIDWFNVQLYNSWGQLTLSDFDRFIKAGTDNVVYPPNKIVMSVASNVQNTENGDWTTGKEIQTNLPQILSAYPDMGGLSCWEWYNAELTAPVDQTAPVLHPEKWFQFVHKIIWG